jgi:quinol monooxygenase YgiN
VLCVVRVKKGASGRFLSRLRREVPGRFARCERFAVFSDPSDPDSVLLYEESSTRDAAEPYIGSEYFRASADALFPLMDGKPDSAYYDAERVGP